MKLVLMINIIDFIESLSREFECEVILSEENNFQHIDDYIIKDEYIYVPMYGLRKYMQEKKGIEITSEYDFIETNLDGVAEEYLIYHIEKN